MTTLHLKRRLNSGMSALGLILSLALILGAEQARISASELNPPEPPVEEACDVPESPELSERALRDEWRVAPTVTVERRQRGSRSL